MSGEVAMETEGRGVAVGSSDVAMATRFAVSEAMSTSVIPARKRGARHWRIS